MNIDNFLIYLGRVFFFLALGLIAVAMTEIATNLFGSSVVEFRYGAGQLIELAGAFLTLVIVILLRQIRDGRML